MSLCLISKELNRSKTFVRKTLLESGVDLRPSCQFPELKKKAPKKYHSGVAPFGYRCLRGRLILDAREIEIVHSVMNLWNSGKSYCAIARQLNGQRIKNRKGTPWEHSLVRSIVERHKDKSLNLEED